MDHRLRITVENGVKDASPMNWRMWQSATSSVGRSRVTAPLLLFPCCMAAGCSPITIRIQRHITKDKKLKNIITPVGSWLGEKTGNNDRLDWGKAKTMISLDWVNRKLLRNDIDSPFRSFGATASKLMECVFGNFPTLKLGKKRRWRNFLGSSHCQT